MSNGVWVEHVSHADKRFKKRVEHNSELFYPRINNKSVYQKYGTNEPILETTNISETGVSFKSRAPLAVGDLINFTLSIEDKPSFWCLAEVKWVKMEEEQYHTGCEFLALTQDQLNIIKEYVEGRKSI